MTLRILLAAGLFVACAACVREVVRRPVLFTSRSEPSGWTERSNERSAWNASGPKAISSSSVVPEQSQAARQAPTASLVREESAPAAVPAGIGVLSTEVADDLVQGADSPPVATAFEMNLVRNLDGTVTKFYSFRKGNPGASKIVNDLLLRFLPEFAALKKDQDWWILEDFARDPRVPNLTQWKDKASPYGLPFGSSSASDLFVVTASEDLVRQIDEFLERILGDAPQIEIEITIVEIAVDDLLRFGINTTLTRGSADDPESSLIDDVTVNLAQDLIEGTIGHFSAIHDDSTINGVIQLLAQSQESQVLSSPKLAVLNGHRAVIDTGAETPFLSPTFSGSGITSIATQFKPTGIRVVVTPFILTGQMVQLDISVEVSAVTGFVTAGIGSGAEVENPLISRRNAFTVVNVPSGKTVMIGGLVATDDLESVDKVPVLGDIPVIGYLFKRRTSTKRKTQVLFFVKPRLHLPDRADSALDLLDY